MSSRGGGSSRSYSFERQRSTSRVSGAQKLLRVPSSGHATGMGKLTLVWERIYSAAELRNR